jgi:hypothetical protein
MMARESLESAVRTPDDVRSVLGEVQVTRIPFLVTKEQREARRRRQRLVVFVIVTAFVGLAMVAHHYWWPLDELLLGFSTKFGFEDVSNVFEVSGQQ